MSNGSKECWQPFERGEIKDKKRKGLRRLFSDERNTRAKPGPSLYNFSGRN